jgi:hypothetical protein
MRPLSVTGHRRFFHRHLSLGGDIVWIELNDTVWAADMPPTVKLVALCLSTYFNGPHDKAFPSETTIAKRTGLSKRTVIRNLQWLVKKEVIRVKQVQEPGARWPLNHYNFLNGLKKLVTPCHRVTPCHPSSDTTPSTGDTTPKGGDTMSPPW